MLTYQKNLQVGGSGAAPLGVGIARKLLVKVQSHWHLNPSLPLCTACYFRTRPVTMCSKSNA